MNNPVPLTLTEPLDIGDARAAAKALASQRRVAEANLESAAIESAEAERKYRKAKAIAYANLAGSNMTAAQREAQAGADSADARYERDLAVGMVKVCDQRLRGLAAEASSLMTLTAWSSRMYEREIPPATVTHGQRAA